MSVSFNTSVSTNPWANQWDTAPLTAEAKTTVKDYCIHEKVAYLASTKRLWPFLEEITPEIPKDVLDIISDYSSLPFPLAELPQACAVLRNGNDKDKLSGNTASDSDSDSDSDYDPSADGTCYRSLKNIENALSKNSHSAGVIQFITSKKQIRDETRNSTMNWGVLKANKVFLATVAGTILFNPPFWVTMAGLMLGYVDLGYYMLRGGNLPSRAQTPV